MNITRRSILLGMIAAPIVVRSGLVMPIKAVGGGDLGLFNINNMARQAMAEDIKRRLGPIDRDILMAMPREFQYLVLDTPLGQY